MSRIKKGICSILGKVANLFELISIKKEPRERLLAYFYNLIIVNKDRSKETIHYTKLVLLSSQSKYYTILQF